MRNWLKNIIREVLKEEISRTPLIISARPPESDDSYQIGARWYDGEHMYECKKVKAEWERVSIKKKKDKK